MIGEPEAVLFRDSDLPVLDGVVDELGHLAAIDAHDVVMVLSRVEFEYCMPFREVMSDNESGRLELRQDAVNRCEAEVVAVVIRAR